MYFLVAHIPTSLGFRALSRFNQRQYHRRFCPSLLLLIASGSVDFDMEWHRLMSWVVDLRVHSVVQFPYSIQIGSHLSESQALRCVLFGVRMCWQGVNTVVLGIIIMYRRHEADMRPYAAKRSVEQATSAKSRQLIDSTAIGENRAGALSRSRLQAIEWMSSLCNPELRKSFSRRCEGKLTKRSKLAGGTVSTFDPSTGQYVEQSGDVPSLEEIVLQPCAYCACWSEV